MAINPTAPGVYIEEVPVLPASVVPVATAVPVFIGYTEKAIINGQAWNFSSGPVKPAPPVRITSMIEFEQFFGKAYPEEFEVVVGGTVSAPTITSITPKSITSPDSTTDYILHYHMQMYFANGGGPCYVIAADKFASSPVLMAGQELFNAIVRAEEVDEITLIVIPEAIKIATGTPSRNDIYDEMVEQCAKLQDRFSIFDVLAGNTVITDDADDFRDNDISSNNLKYGAAYYPSLKTSVGLYMPDAGVVMSGVLTGSISTLLTGATPNTKFYNTIKAELAKSYGNLKLYPSSTMAGIYASVDRTRGVWKAPANVSATFVVEPTVAVDEATQGYFNIDPTGGKSINVIRKFTGKGTLVWGARTLAGNDNEWRYVNVRRLFIMAEESIKKATEFVVFEPNDANTWSRTKALITNFLINLWRDGALVGAKPEHAFFVKVGLNETMTPQDILEGKLIIQIGLAASRPAEFIILQFMHKLQES